MDGPRWRQFTAGALVAAAVWVSGGVYVRIPDPRRDDATEMLTAGTVDVTTISATIVVYPFDWPGA
jgi:hypothetical protein